MLIFWVIFAVLDLLILFFFMLLCIISLRQAPNDIRKHEFRSGSQLYLLQQEVLKDGCFFKERTEEELILKANGAVLYARRYTQEKPKGRILLFHGYRSIAETDFACTIDCYYNWGYELILVDQRAHGKSSGNWIGFGVLERQDCLAWIHELNNKFQPLPTFLCGISMGASTVLMASELSLPENVCGIIADCGFTSPKEIIAYIIRQKLRLPPPLLLPVLSCFSKIFAGYFFGECSAEEALKRNKHPVLFIHGKEDRFVPPEMTIANYNACAAEKRLVLVDHATHGTSFLQERPRVEQEIHDFLQKHNT